MQKTKFIKVKDTKIGILQQKEGDYISLTDMLQAKDGDFFISDWLRNRNTVEFLAIWESVYNPNFNYGESAIIKSKSGLNNYKLSVKEWIEKTNSIGLKATAGRYGGTYAHKDIAFEFGMWISAEFKIYLIKEFQRLKEEENQNKNLQWSLQRTLAKVNYKIHTDAIKENLIPPVVSKQQTAMIYANEADLLNVALFGKTAAEFRSEKLGSSQNSSQSSNQNNQNNQKPEANLRDEATLEQLVVLTNLESLNAVLIKQNLPQNTRLKTLNEIAVSQMKSLLGSAQIKALTVVDGLDDADLGKEDKNRVKLIKN